jgi:hypothetical protein
LLVTAHLWHDLWRVGIHEKDGAVSQRSVEIVIGRLATDEEFRGRFEASREAALDELTRAGAALTPVERRALLEIDVTACERFASCLDARLQKVDVRAGVDREAARSTTSRGSTSDDV